MRTWTLNEIMRGAVLPQGLDDLAADLLIALHDCVGIRPTLVHLGRQDGEEDEHGFEVLVELAPGVQLRECFGRTVAVECAPTLKVSIADVEAVSARVLDNVERCTARLPQLGRRLHQARVDARRILGEWRREGLEARLRNLVVAPLELWSAPMEPQIQIKLDTLGPGLQTISRTIDVALSETVAQALAHERPKIERRSRRAAEMARLGATGTIDQLALNALAHLGDVAAQLRRLASEWSLNVPERDLRFRMTDGHVKGEVGNDGASVRISGREVTIRSTFVPETRLRAAIGRPVTELVDQEFLSGEMTVVGASSSVENGEPLLVIALDMPRQAFCSVTGEHWRLVEAEPAMLDAVASE